MIKKKYGRKHSDFSNVTKMNNELIPEEYPEGAFGSAIGADTPVFSKSTPWEEGQRRKSSYIYPDQEQHAGSPRKAPGAHIPHSEQEEQ